MPHTAQHMCNHHVAGDARSVTHNQFPGYHTHTCTMHCQTVTIHAGLLQSTAGLQDGPGLCPPPSPPQARCVTGCNKLQRKNLTPTAGIEEGMYLLGIDAVAALGKAQIDESLVAAWLQELPHNAIRLGQVPLDHQHPTPVLPHGTHVRGQVYRKLEDLLAITRKRKQHVGQLADHVRLETQPGWKQHSNGDSIL